MSLVNLSFFSPSTNDNKMGPHPPAPFPPTALPPQWQCIDVRSQCFLHKVIVFLQVFAEFYFYHPIHIQHQWSWIQMSRLKMHFILLHTPPHNWFSFENKSSAFKSYRFINGFYTCIPTHIFLFTFRWVYFQQLRYHLRMRTLFEGIVATSEVPCWLKRLVINYIKWYIFWMICWEV